MSDAELLSPARSPLRRLTGVQIIGTGSYVPENVVTNDDLARLGCDADWIIQRTGIRERRHAPPEIATSDMAVAAAERCLQAAGVDRDRVDLLVLGTLSPDYLLPATAAAVQDRLKLNCPAMDVSAACAGFMYALVTGMQYVASGCSEYALVIGADTNSRVMNPDDKKTFPPLRRRGRRCPDHPRQCRARFDFIHLRCRRLRRKTPSAVSWRLARSIQKRSAAVLQLVRLDGWPPRFQMGRAIARRFLASRPVGRRLHDCRRKTLALPSSEHSHSRRRRRRPRHRSPKM